MTIGIVIPCYKPHIGKLVRLLESIDAQTLSPDAVVVSCSSATLADFPTLRTYKFPITFITHSGRLNAAQNRNCAAKLLNTEFVSFFDADDIMHPQRIEAILTAFSIGAQIVLHNYNDSPDARFEHIDGFDVEYDTIARADSGCTVHKHDTRIKIHHSQASVVSHILNRIKFDEDTAVERREDSLFCGNVVAAGYKTGYISNPLSNYDPAGETIIS